MQNVTNIEVDAKHNWLHKSCHVDVNATFMALGYSGGYKYGIQNMELRKLSSPDHVVDTLIGINN